MEQTSIVKAGVFDGYSWLTSWLFMWFVWFGESKIGRGRKQGFRKKRIEILSFLGHVVQFSSVF